VLEEVKAELKERIEESNAKVVSDELPVTKVIPFQFHQLVLNILSNALKFTRPGVIPEIKVSASIESGKNIKSGMVMKHQNYHHLSFTDNGIGFDPAYSTKIFEIFQRLHNRDTYEGTGVGLAICKKIVENHQGIIMAEGRANEGATIHVYLPVSK
jgi:light-regulated signal transduction histidine kinase (bacteriophytochrome)